MKIIVLGAGQVGTTVATNLAQENNDVTVVDTNETVLNELNSRLDVQTVVGKASYPAILRQAGAEDADMLIACTSSDEVNMAACQIAYSLFHTPTKIARIRTHEYTREKELFQRDHVPIDVLIAPELLVTNHIQRLIEHPGAFQVLDFAEGHVRMIGARVSDGAALADKPLHELKTLLPYVNTRVVAVYRGEQAIIPDGDTVIKGGDEVFFIAATSDAPRVMATMRTWDTAAKKVMIAGGGNIGKALAENLEKKYRVKLIERSTARADVLANQLHKTLVLGGDAADQDLLLEEHIDDMDIYCAVTNHDEANILSAMLAKRLGAKKVMALVNRPGYVDLVPANVIDLAISPQQITIGALLTHIRRGDVVAVHSLRHGAAEAIEAIAHGDISNSKVVGRSIEDISLPPDTTITALVRGEDLIMAHHNTVIEPEDHVILFVTDKRRIHQVENLFQVGVTFI